LHQLGFTLVELMVVIAIVVILLVIAVPSFAEYIDRARLRGAADGALSLVADARTASVQRNRDVIVSFGGTDPAWCMGAKSAADPTTLGKPVNAVVDDVACDCTTPSGCTVGTQSNDVVASSTYNGVTMGTRPLSSVIFDSRLGTVSGLTSTSVTMTSPKGKYQIQLIVAPLGQASLCVPPTMPSIPGISSC
jgi:type IV fimbrial biogenesis protein FimT